LGACDVANSFWRTTIEMCSGPVEGGHTIDLGKRNGAIMLKIKMIAIAAVLSVVNRFDR